MNVGSVSPIGADIILKLPPYILYRGASPVWGKWSIDLAASWSAMDCDMIKNMRCDQDQHPWHHNIWIIIIYASLWAATASDMGRSVRGI